MPVLSLLGWILMDWQYSQLDLSFRFYYYVWSFHFKSGAEEMNEIREPWAIVLKSLLR